MTMDFTVFVDDVDVSQIACPTLGFGGKSQGGDASADWDFAFPDNVIPDDYAPVSILDTASGEEIWSGRFVWELPDWDGCSSKVKAKPEGMVASLTDQVFHESIVYGPQRIKAAAPPDQPTAVIIDPVLVALTPEASITHAVSQLCPSVTLGAIAETTTTLSQRSPNFFNKHALSVIKWVSGLFDYLETPFLYHVRRGEFTWWTMPTEPRYEVKLADGARIGIVRDPSAVSNRTLVGYGKNQGATSPDPSDPGAAIDYSEISIIRDVGVDLSGQTNKLSVARQLADGMRARGPQLKLGWKYQLTLGRNVLVYDRQTAMWIKPWMIQAGEVIEISDLGHTSFGNRTVPQDHFITDFRVDHSGKVSISCGETRTQEQIATMRTMVGSFEPIADTLRPGGLKYNYSLGGHDKNVPFGGPLFEDYTGFEPGREVLPTIPEPPHPPNPDGDPQGVDWPPSTGDKTFPQHSPGQPPAGTITLMGADLQTAGVRAVINVAPVTVLGWEINSSVEATFTLKLYLKSTGALVLTASIATGDAVTVGAHTFYSTDMTYLDPPYDIGIFDRLAVVVDTADAAFPDDAWAGLALNFARLWPGYPDLARDPETDELYIDVPFGLGKNA